MWRPGVQFVPYNILSEVMVRIVLLVIVCLMHVHIEPYMQDITESDLLRDYRRPRKDSIVPPWAMAVLIICVPVTILSMQSLFTSCYQDMTQSLLAWTLACSINAFITESGKLIIGRPRPDYFYRCYPNGRFTGKKCTGLIRDVLEGRKSFPSGHSSFSFCSLGFISIWLCGKLRVLSRNRGEGLRVVTCLVPLVVAGVVAMSRCCDNHHHWEDVFAGSIIGFTAAYFCYRQYYYALDSEQAGHPYVRGSGLRNVLAHEECCSKDLTETSSECDKEH